MFDYNIDTDQLNASSIFDFSVTPGWSVTGSAGGAFIGEYNGSVCFFGDVDQSPNLIGIYSLGDFTPLPPTPPEGDVFFDFNDGIMRWTTIDGDGDGHNWEMRQNWGSGDNPWSVTSASFDDFTQTVLFPENYLVTPYKLDCEEITFKACAQDVSAPAEHVGVAVSTIGNTNATDFTIVWEAELTAKFAGNWYEYDVDLRDYQGQEIYVAIVHFNCSDQFMLNIDDVTLYRTYDGLTENDAVSLETYPNPVSDQVRVESSQDIEGFELYTVTGSLIELRDVNAKALNLDLSNQPAGIYLLKIHSEGLTQTRRLIKQ